MISDVRIYDAHEAFYMALSWFVGHLEAVAAEPAKASELHGCYNVAHEFWYFVGGEEFVVSDPLRLLQDEVRASVICAIETVKAVPEEARVWTTTTEGSLRNMRHPQWVPARRQAREAMRQLEPVIANMKAFFLQANPSFQRTAPPPPK